jgi:hypothetical protein
MSQPLFGNPARDLVHKDAIIFGRHQGCKRQQLIAITGVVRTIIDKEHSLRPMQFCISHLARKQGMLGQILAVEHALCIVLLGLMTKDQDNFVPHIEAGVVIVLVLGGCNAVARKNDASPRFPVCTEVERHEIGALF